MIYCNSVSQEVLKIEELKNISFKVPKSFFVEIKKRLIDVDMNLKEYIIYLIKEDLEKAQEKDK